MKMKTYGRQLFTFWSYTPGDNYDDWSWDEKTIFWFGATMFWLPVGLVALVTIPLYNFIKRFAK